MCRFQLLKSARKYLTFEIFLVPISLGVIAVSFILAFSSLIRSFIALVFDLAWTKTTTATGLYMWWKERKNDSKALTLRRVNKTQKWKEESRARKQKERKDKNTKDEERKKIKDQVPQGPQQV
jgi:hypothetical protein